MEVQFRSCPNTWIPERKTEALSPIMQILKPGFCWYSFITWYFMWSTGMLVTDSLVIQNSYLLFLGGQQIKFQGPRFQYIEGDSNSLWAKSIDCKKEEEYFCIFLNFYRSLLSSLWPPWSKKNNNQPAETPEVKWQQILLLWRLPTCSFKILPRKLDNQILLKGLFKHKVNGLTRSAESQQLCFHCTAELSSCIGPFLNLWLLGVLGKGLCAFGLLRLICFWTNETCSAPAGAIESCLFAKGRGFLAVWSSLRRSYYTMPRLWCLVQQRGESSIAFPNWTNQALLLLLPKHLFDLTWVNSFPKMQLLTFHLPIPHHLKHLFGYVNQLFW